MLEDEDKEIATRKLPKDLFPIELVEKGALNAYVEYRRKADKQIQVDSVFDNYRDVILKTVSTCAKSNSIEDIDEK